MKPQQAHLPFEKESALAESVAVLGFVVGACR